MEKLLDFNKPKKVSSTEDHNREYRSDAGIDGTYVQNMNQDDMVKWKAKHIKGDDERIEIRKTLGGVQLVAVVYKRRRQTENADWRDRMTDHNDVKLSMNGKLDMTWDEWWELQDAVKEALENLL
jgi:hypothetical protein